MAFYGCTAPLTSQQLALLKSWPKNSLNKHLDYDPVYMGYIVTTNGDTLRGLMKFGSTYKPHETMTRIMIIPLGQNKKDSIIHLRKKDINYIRSFEDSTKNKFTDFLKLPNGGLYRLIEKANDIGMYISNSYTNGTYNCPLYKGGMLLYKDKTEVIISIGNFFSNNLRSPQKNLVQFINKRYQQDFNKEDFKDEKAMVDYILNKENESLENTK
jgi:hypothetical protein